jgi:Helix-turn-helix domain
MSKMSKESPITISVPEAGKRYFGLCRNATYDAAARGDIPVIKIGRLLRVPVLALERMIERASEPSGSAHSPSRPDGAVEGRGPESDPGTFT